MNIGASPVTFGRGTLRVCRRTNSILLVALSRPELLNAFNDDGKQRMMNNTVHRFGSERKNLMILP